VINYLSYGKEKPFIHPFVFFIVQYGVEDVITSIKNHDVNAAIESLYFFLTAVDPEIKEGLSEEIKTLEAIRQGQLTTKTDALVITIMNKVYDKLHGAGYFLAAKMRPPTREKSMKEIEVETAKAKYGKK
jgi:hypothetical protein